MTHEQYLLAQIARVTARHYIELQALIIDHYANLDADTQVESVSVDDEDAPHVAEMDVQAPPNEAQPVAPAHKDDVPLVLDQPAPPRRGRRSRGAPVAQVEVQKQPEPPARPSVTPVAQVEAKDHPAPPAQKNDAPPENQPAPPRRGRRSRVAPVAQAEAQELRARPSVTPVGVPDDLAAPLGGQNADPADLFSRWGGAA